MNANEGHLYCFGNSHMPNVYKIGTTKNGVENMLKIANNTKDMLPFECIISKRFNNISGKKKELKKHLNKYGRRVYAKREFFEIELGNLFNCFDLVEDEDV